MLIVKVLTFSYNDLFCEILIFYSNVSCRKGLNFETTFSECTKCCSEITTTARKIPPSLIKHSKFMIEDY